MTESLQAIGAAYIGMEIGLIFTSASRAREWARSADLPANSRRRIPVGRGRLHLWWTPEHPRGALVHEVYNMSGFKLDPRMLDAARFSWRLGKSSAIRRLSP